MPGRTPHRRPAIANMGIGTKAPMIRSPKPSPLTSPAPATEKPLWSSSRRAIDPKAVRAVEGGEFEAGRKSPKPCRTPHRRRRYAAVGTGPMSPDDQVGKAIAIDVAGAGDGKAAVVACRLAIDLKAVGAVQGGEIERRGESPTPCRTPHRRRRCLAIGIGSISPNDQIGEAVTVDIAGAGDGVAALVTRRFAVDRGSRWYRRGRRVRSQMDSLACQTPR